MSKKKWLTGFFGLFILIWGETGAADRVDVRYFALSKTMRSEFPTLVSSDVSVERSELQKHFPLIKSKLQAVNEGTGLLWVIEASHDSDALPGCLPELIEAPLHPSVLSWLFEDKVSHVPFMPGSSMTLNIDDYDQPKLVFNIAGNKIIQPVNAPEVKSLKGCQGSFHAQWMVVLPEAGSTMPYGNPPGLTLGGDQYAFGGGIGGSDENFKKRPYGGGAPGTDFDVFVMNTGLYFEANPLAESAGYTVNDGTVLHIIYDDGHEAYLHLDAVQWQRLWENLTGGFLDLQPPSGTLYTHDDDQLVHDYLSSVTGIVSFGKTKNTGGASYSGASSSSTGGSSQNTGGSSTGFHQRLSGSSSGEDSGGDDGEGFTSRQCDNCGRWVSIGEYVSHRSRCASGSGHSLEAISGRKRKSASETESRGKRSFVPSQPVPKAKVGGLTRSEQAKLRRERISAIMQPGLPLEEPSHKGEINRQAIEEDAQAVRLKKSWQDAQTLVDSHLSFDSWKRIIVNAYTYVPFSELAPEEYIAMTRGGSRRGVLVELSRAISEGDDLSAKKAVLNILRLTLNEMAANDPGLQAASSTFSNLMADFTEEVMKVQEREVSEYYDDISVFREHRLLDALERSALKPVVENAVNSTKFLSNIISALPEKQFEALSPLLAVSSPRLEWVSDLLKRFAGRQVDELWAYLAILSPDNEIDWQEAIDIISTGVREIWDDLSEASQKPMARLYLEYIKDHPLITAGATVAGAGASSSMVKAVVTKEHFSSGYREDMPLKEFMDLAIRIKNFNRLGVNLGLGLIEVDNMKANNRSEGVSSWLMELHSELYRRAFDLSYQKVAEALEGIGENKAAQDIKDQFRISHDAGERITLDTVLNQAHYAMFNEKLTDIAASWKHLGIQLRLWPSQLDVIERNNPRDSYQCFSEMLSAWLNGREQYRTPRFLIRALRAIRYIALAEKVEKLFKN